MDKLVKQLKDMANKTLGMLSQKAKKATEEAKKAGAAAAGAKGSTAVSAPSGGSRPMKFPYTYTAKVLQFPWVYYIKYNWVYRYYMIAIIVCFPIFKKISNVFNSPTNVAKWEEIKRKEREQEALHEH